MVWGLETRVLRLLDEGKPGEARELLEASLARAGGRRLRYLNLLGVCEAYLHHLSYAEEIFSQVLWEDPDNVAALNNLGNVYFLQKQYELAKEQYLRAMKLSMWRPEPYLNLARTYLHLGLAEKALETELRRADLHHLAKWLKAGFLLGLVLILIAILAR